ncbi:hypothetical protein M0R04_11795 [Candidatus Dojkabacteria bacterium]|jgi:hypothetical protein|nr:hypothetical protein [Candidatus Dojkabacteria bacterium]
MSIISIKKRIECIQKEVVKFLCESNKDRNYDKNLLTISVMLSLLSYDLKKEEDKKCLK